MKKNALGMIIVSLCVMPFLAASTNNIFAEEYSGDPELLQTQGVQSEEQGDAEIEISNAYIFDELDQNAPVLDTPVFYEDLLQAQSLPESYATNVDEITAKYPNTRNQNPYGTCWAFSSVGLAEFDLINDGIYDKSIDLSELQLAYFTYNFEKDPLGGTEGDTAKYTTVGSGPNYLNYGGNYQRASRRLAQWIGTVDESDVPYSTADAVLLNGVESQYAYSRDVAHLENAYVLSIKNNPEEVKRQIMAHGAAGASYLHRNDALTYNDSLCRYVYYDSENSGAGHAVMLVGWDDNFSKDNFSGGNVPSSDGAWLIRNSWGTFVDYFWMSYENASLQDGAWIFDFSSSNNYDNNYQLDGGLDTFYTSYLKVANVFKAKSEDGVAAETLKAISLSTTRQTNVGYKICVYTDLQDVSDPTSGTLWEAATTTGTVTYAGIHTIELNSPVVIMPGSLFSVVITVDKEAVDYEQAASWVIDGSSTLDCTVSQLSGNSFYADSVDGKLYKWGFGNFCIKAFTNDESSIPDIPIPDTHKCEEHWNTEMTVDVEPTCTTKGRKSIHCSVCNEEKAGSAVEIPAKGHSWKTVSSDGGVTNYKCSICGATKSEGTAWNGLHKASDGNVYLYRNGIIDKSYIGMALYGSEWLYVKAGKVDYHYTGMACNEYGWWYFKDGALDWNYTGMACNEYGWWYYRNGTLDWTYTGMACNEYGWWYYNNGTLDMNYTGMACNEYGWWYYNNGRLDWNYTGMACNEYGWWYYNNGTLDWTYTGMACNEYGWWYYNNGRLDWNYTGMACNEYGWWYYNNGRLDWNYTGMACNEYGWWYYNNGRLDWNYTGMACNEYGWWYFNNGVLDWNYTGVAYNEYGTWYFVNGRLVY